MIIFIDKSGDPGFKTKRGSSTHFVKNLRFRDSKNDVLIQMGDMVAGSIRRDFDKNTNDYDVYRKIIKHKEEDVWEFK